MQNRGKMAVEGLWEAAENGYFCSSLVYSALQVGCQFANVTADEISIVPNLPIVDLAGQRAHLVFCNLQHPA